MKFEITILSSGTGNPTNKLNQSAQYLHVYNNHFLLDCGESTQHQIIKFGLSYQKIQRIFISHLHADHYCGLIGLINTMNLNRRNNDLHIHAPKELKNIISVQLKHSKVELGFEIKYFPLSFNSIKKIYENNSLQVFSFPLKHRIPTCGFLFREKQLPRNIKKDILKERQIPIEAFKTLKNGENYEAENGETYLFEECTNPPPPSRSYAYITDTLCEEAVVKIIEYVDLLYHEASFCEEHKQRALESFHSTAQQAAAIASKAHVKKLIIGHFSTRYKETDSFLEEASAIFSNTELAFEGKRISISLKK